MKLRIANWIFVALSLLWMNAHAQTLPTNYVCPNSGFFAGAVISNICWTCVFPIRIMGVPIGGSPTNVPDDAAAPFCVCPGKLFGIPSPGMTMGMWQPTHMFEIVRQPWCSPILGTTLGGSSSVANMSRWGGYQSNEIQGGHHGNTQATYQFHWWIFPLSVIFDTIDSSVCTGKNSGDMDLAYVSEIDPTWADSSLALYTAPETILFANPVAIMACMADAVSATTYKPQDALFWCAGSWGHSYPWTGVDATVNSPPRTTSLTSFRALAALHRRGLAQKTMGDDAVCANHVAPIIPKQQYKLQTFYPLPETTNNHWLGQNTFTWGEWRNIPVKGEDYVYVQWNWVDCCITYY